LLVVAVFLGWGIPALRGLGQGPASQNAWGLAGKLAVFVAGPLVVWRWRFAGSPARLLGFPVSLRGHWRPVLGMSALLAGFQLLFGRALRELAQLAPTAGEITIALLLGSLWLIVEVGLVEEFFFRAMLQERLTAWLGSPPRAIVATAVLFGLAHVPGLYLRPENMGEAVSDRSLGAALGYALLLTSVTGFFLGVLWQRTRNLAALAVVHTVNDLVPGLADAIRMMRHH
jgi:membrane protease YdiL (CAAX protease family)